MAGVLPTQTYNNSSYAVLPKMTWHDAQTKAQEMGGNLVTINDVAEEKWLQQTFGNGAFWTGFNDQAQEGQWQWASGEAVTYTNWLTNKPDNKNGNEDFALMGVGKTDQWNDKDGSLLKKSIIEIKTAPSVLEAIPEIQPSTQTVTSETVSEIKPVVQTGMSEITNELSAIASDTQLTFNFTYEGDAQGGSAVSEQQMIAFEMAGRIWSQYLQDDVTLNIHIDVTDDLPDNVIGGAIPGFAEEDYIAVKENLTRDQSSNNDAKAVNNLNNSKLDSFVTLFRDETSSKSSTAPNSFISPTRANLKAVGSSLVEADASSLDGYILMNNLANAPVEWHYDQYDESGQNQDLLKADEIDFLSVAIHEIGHVLGFVSGVDYQQSDWANLYANAYTETDYSDVASVTQQNEFADILRNRTGVASMLDLFRYDPIQLKTEEQLEATLARIPEEYRFEISNRNELSIGGNPFFSLIDGMDVENPLFQFANGRLDDSFVAQQVWGGLDNFQASHWTQETDGIMVPAISPGQRNAISDNELIAFDVLGFDRTSGFSLPDYASLYQSAQSAVNQYSSSRTTKSRLDDVIAMIDSSPMYEGRRRTSSSVRRQELMDVFAQEALNSTFDEEAWQRYLERISVKKSGTDGEDKLQGTIGGDRIWGMENADILKGYDGDDWLKGNQGSDRILGGEGNDTLIGGNGDDILKGEAGNDLIKGGAGIDVIVGGQGTDTFMIDKTAGFDVIRDFTIGEDQLFIAKGIEVSIGQRNNHAILTLASDNTNMLAVLRNVDATEVAIS